MIILYVNFFHICLIKMQGRYLDEKALNLKGLSDCLLTALDIMQCYCIYCLLLTAIHWNIFHSYFSEEFINNFQLTKNLNIF